VCTKEEKGSSLPEVAFALNRNRHKRPGLQHQVYPDRNTKSQPRCCREQLLNLGHDLFCFLTLVLILSSIWIQIANSNTCFRVRVPKGPQVYRFSYSFVALGLAVEALPRLWALPRWKQGTRSCKTSYNSLNLNSRQVAVFVKAGDVFWVSSRARVGCALIQVECWGWTPTYELVLTFDIRRETSLRKGKSQRKSAVLSLRSRFPANCEIVSDSALQIPKTTNPPTLTISRLVCCCSGAERFAYTLSRQYCTSNQRWVPKCLARGSQFELDRELRHYTRGAPSIVCQNRFFPTFGHNGERLQQLWE
jgi:hypothetical protein